MPPPTDIQEKTAAAPLGPLRFMLMFSLPFAMVFLILLIALMAWERNSRELDLTIELRESARAYFKQILITRLWNADHGGVYAEVTDAVKPNPYLKDDPWRDIITQDGRTYTKINPAYMTRQLSELAHAKGKYTFRITSLRPVNVQNSPDPWETLQLTAFEQEKKAETYEIIEEGTRKKFRYMAPLKVDEACLKCHWKQGYTVGDVRGGISIDIPMDIPMQSFTKRLKLIMASMSVIGIASLGFIIAITWIFSKKIARGIHEEIERERLKTMIQLAGGTAHEIRQPLTVIVGCIELLKNKKAPGDSSEEEVEYIVKQCSRIDSIIEKMLNITKFRTKQYSDGTEIFDLHAQTEKSEDTV